MSTVSKELERVGKGLKHVGLRKQIYALYEELAPLVAAGIPLVRALEDVTAALPSKALRRDLAQVSAEVMEGKSLSIALQNAGLTNVRIDTLLRTGERSGGLAAALEMIVEQNQKEVEFRGAVRGSLLYSVIVLTLALVIGIGTPLIILPQLVTFFEGMNVALPPLTQVLISIGQFFTAYGTYVLPIMVLLLLGVFYFLFSFPQTRFLGHSLLFNLPLFRQLIREAEVARFSYLLATQLSAGITIVEAMDTLPFSTTYRNYRSLYISVREQVSQGKRFADSIRNYPNYRSLIPSSAVSMFEAGEQSGALPTMLRKVSTQYETKIQQTARTIPIILEPVVLFIVGIMVAVIALGIIQPIYGLSDAII